MEFHLHICKFVLLPFQEPSEQRFLLTYQILLQLFDRNSETFY